MEELEGKKDYIPEKKLKNQAKSVSAESLKIIIEFCENKICKIKCKDESYGTGFFCFIPINEWDTFMALITNNHVLTKNDISIGNRIYLSLNNEKKQLEIIIDENRKTFTSKEFDITIIEIRKNDGLNKDSFLEIDNKIFNDKIDIFQQNSIYLLHYPKGGEAEFSTGIIQKIANNGFTIEHLCDSRGGSSGGPLINSTNFKVIGIHKGAAYNSKNFNVGTFLKKPIELFNKEINKRRETKNIEMENEKNIKDNINKVKEKIKDQNIIEENDGINFLDKIYYSTIKEMIIGLNEIYKIYFGREIINSSIYFELENKTGVRIEYGNYKFKYKKEKIIGFLTINEKKKKRKRKRKRMLYSL